MTNKINGIDVSEYFTNHYDNEGKLYAVEYKGNPLELQNAIKHLQEENNILKQTIKNKNFVAIVKENEELRQVRKNSPDIQEPYIYLYRQIKKQYHKLEKENEKLKADLKGETEQCQKWYQLETDKHFQMLKYEQALEEIRNEIGDLKNINRLINLQKILDIINEALYDRD